MPEKIVNRVAKSKLVTLNLEDYCPEAKRLSFDLKDWLYEGFVLREKEFRKAVKTHNWATYQDSFIALSCSSEAIVPTWAYMLITANLQPFAHKIVFGDLNTMENAIFQEAIEKIDVSKFKDLPVIIKGCSKKPVPQNAYLLLVQKLQPVVKSLLFGEACSSVPVYKRPK